MPHRLDVAKVVYGALVLPWQERKSFFKALVIPIGLLITLSLSRLYFDDGFHDALPWLFLGLFVILFTLFAVPCHRLALLGPEQEGTHLPKWTSRETVFLIWLALLWGSIMVGLMASTVLAGTLSMNMLGPQRSGVFSLDRVLWYLSMLPAYYLTARFSLILPATAIDRRISPADAWNLSRNNGLRLMLVVYAVPWAIGLAVDFAYRNDSSAIEVGILALLEYATFAIQICALSLAYRELSRAG